MPAPELAKRLLEELADDANELGCANHLETVWQILREGPAPGASSPPGSDDQGHRGRGPRLVIASAKPLSSTARMAGPELSVVCRNCGSEVSPYVTECPYCGTRIRKRAPRLEREGDEIKIREGRREKKLRRDAERRERTEERRRASARWPRAARSSPRSRSRRSLLLAIPAILYIVLRATDRQGVVAIEATQAFIEIFDARSETTRGATSIAPFVFVNAGYLFICGVGDRDLRARPRAPARLDPAFILGLACGALGILAADGVSDCPRQRRRTSPPGANGIALGLLAAYVAIREPERRADPEESYDPIAVGVAAAVLLGDADRLPVRQPVGRDRRRPGRRPLRLHRRRWRRRRA